MSKTTRPVPVEEIRAKLKEANALSKEANSIHLQKKYESTAEYLRNSKIRRWRRNWNAEQIIKYMKDTETFFGTLWGHAAYRFSTPYGMNKIAKLIATFDNTDIINIDVEDAGMIYDHINQCKNYIDKYKVPVLQ